MYLVEIRDRFTQVPVEIHGPFPIATAGREHARLAAQRIPQTVTVLVPAPVRR